MSTAPDGLPALSRGSHRDVRDGGCFMEIASMLAGEPWSDHPSCTHPLLAAVVRGVNDSSTDEGRRSLAPMVPDVVGATSTDPGIAPRLVLVCTAHALPAATGDLRRELERARDRAMSRAAHLARHVEPTAQAPVQRGSLAHRLAVSWRRYMEWEYLLDAYCAVDYAVDAITRDPVGADERLRSLLVACLEATTQHQSTRYVP